jgi:preprotein translocase subunit SecB
MEKTKDLEKRYNEFNSNIEFRSIRLLKLETGFDDEKISISPETQKVYIDRNAYYQVLDDNNIRVFQEFSLKIAQKDDPNDIFCYVNPTFVLDFKTSTPIDDEIFNIFSQSTVIIDSWPYFREMVQNSFLRMGLSPVIIPPMQFNPAEIQENLKKENQ